MQNTNKILLACLVLTLALFSTGCVANMFPGGPVPAGGIVTNVKSPAQGLAVATDAAAQSKMTGSASNAAFLGLFAFGDAGVDAAMNNGGISKVHHVDHQVFSILWGLFMKNTTIVHGE